MKHFLLRSLFKFHFERVDYADSVEHFCDVNWLEFQLLHKDWLLREAFSVCSVIQTLHFHSVYAMRFLV